MGLWRPSRVPPFAKETPMSPLRIVALVLMIAGVVALAAGSFSYTRDKTAIKLGPMELSVKERKTVDVPIWAGIAAIVVGGVLFAVGRKR